MLPWSQILSFCTRWVSLAPAIEIFILFHEIFTCWLLHVLVNADHQTMASWSGAAGEFYPIRTSTRIMLHQPLAVHSDQSVQAKPRLRHVICSTDQAWRCLHFGHANTPEAIRSSKNKIFSYSCIWKRKFSRAGSVIMLLAEKCWFSGSELRRCKEKVIHLPGRRETAFSKRRSSFFLRQRRLVSMQ